MTVSLIFVAGRIEKLLKSRGGGPPPHGTLPVLDRVPPCGVGLELALRSVLHGTVWCQISGTRSGSWWPPPTVMI